MKLYQLDLSPFAARVRAQLYAKGIEIPFVEPPGGLGSDAYKRINPIGKIPALALDDGGVLPESSVIAEYLEDRFPSPSLRPVNSEDRARMRLLVQIGDQYLFPALHDLYPQVLDPKARDQGVVDAGFARLAPQYALVARFLSASGPYAAGAQLSLADTALYPIFFFATRVHAALGGQDPTAQHTPLAAWWKCLAEHPAIQKVDAEMTKALAAMMAERTG